jgi:branched-chain amino acid transport system substrate-binding protein
VRVLCKGNIKSPRAPALICPRPLNRNSDEKREKEMTMRANILSLMFVFVATNATAADSTRGVTDSEIVLGTHNDLSGPAVAPGTATVNGMQMRIDEINAAGGVNGRKLRLVVEDTQYQVPRAVQAGNKLINHDNVFAIVAGLGTPMNNAVFPMQEKAGVPNLFPTTQARNMWSPLNRLKFAFNADNQQQVAAGVMWMIGKGKKNFCIEYQDTDYGKDILAGLQDALKENNLPLVAKETHKPADTDLGTQMLTLRNAKCEVVILGTLIRDGIIAYTTARRSGWNDVEFVGPASLYDPTVASVADNATEGLYAVTPTYIPDRDKMSDAARGWFDKYKEKYGRDAPPAAMNAYTAIDLTAIALEKAGKEVTLDKFIDGMESIKDYKDVFGNPPQSYGPDKHLGSDFSYVARVGKDKWELVAGPVQPK